MSTIQILDRRSRLFVDATILDDVTQRHLALTEDGWKLFRDRARKMQSERGMQSPESVDWDWAQKRLEFGPQPVQVIAIERDNESQGLVMLAPHPVASRLSHSPDSLALYVEYLEAAPWNLTDYVGTNARYGLIGTALLRCAVAVSLDRGCSGRLALHSLHGAETFYRAKGFEDLGYDQEEHLRYFELSERQAQKLITGGET